MSARDPMTEISCGDLLRDRNQDRKRRHRLLLERQYRDASLPQNQDSGKSPNRPKETLRNSIEFRAPGHRIRGWHSLRSPQDRAPIRRDKAHGNSDHFVPPEESAPGTCAVASERGAPVRNAGRQGSHIASRKLRGGLSWDMDERHKNYKAPISMSGRTCV